MMESTTTATTTATATTTLSSSSIPQMSALQETFLLPSNLQNQEQEQNQDQEEKHPLHLSNLALQVLHNLQHQHRWTDLHLHTHHHHYNKPEELQPKNKETNQKQKQNQMQRKLLPRPLISGLPLQRLYIHPDEQIALLQEANNNNKKEGNVNTINVKGGDLAMTASSGVAAGGGLNHVQSEREWVCPSQLREKWSLRKFGDIFDSITLLPPSSSSSLVDGDEGEGEDQGEDDEDTKNKWRTTKRVLLATVDDDSTVVYYIVHDGIVKPRQN